MKKIKPDWLVNKYKEIGKKIESLKPLLVEGPEELSHIQMSKDFKNFYNLMNERSNTIQEKKLQKDIAINKFLLSGNKRDAKKAIKIIGLNEEEKSGSFKDQTLLCMIHKQVTCGKLFKKIYTRISHKEQENELFDRMETNMHYAIGTLHELENCYYTQAKALKNQEKYNLMDALQEEKKIGEDAADLIQRYQGADFPNKIKNALQGKKNMEVNEIFTSIGMVFAFTFGTSATYLAMQNTDSKQLKKDIELFGGLFATEIEVSMTGEYRSNFSTIQEMINVVMKN